MTEPLRPPVDTAPQTIETDQQPIALPTPAHIGQAATDTPAAATDRPGITVTTWPGEAEVRSRGQVSKSAHLPP